MHVPSQVEIFQTIYSSVLFGHLCTIRSRYVFIIASNNATC